MSIVLDGTTGITTPDLTDTSLTSGRVVYAGTGGNLTGSTALTFDGAILGVNGISVGRGAGAVATNTAVGASALAANTSGVNNLAVGYQAAYSATTGSYLTAIGYQAGYSYATTTSAGTFVGWQAGYTTTGDNNVAIGARALYVNSTGSYNTAIGDTSLRLNTTASFNTAVGYQAGYSNTTGQTIDAFGYVALYSNTTGTLNTALGSVALYLNTTGSSNTAVGREALRSNTTASNNTAVGYGAGYSNTTSNSSTFVGFQSGYYSTGTVNNFFGTSAGVSMTSGSKNTIIGSYTGNQGGLDIRTASNYIVLSDGDGNPRVYHSSAAFYVQSVYDNTTAVSANVCVASNGGISRATSALKYKQDIRNLENIDINLFRAVRYKSKCNGDDQTKDHFGVIADEVDAAGIKELVTYGADNEVEGFQYERLTVVLLKKLQTLDAEFQAYKASHP